MVPFVTGCQFALAIVGGAVIGSFGATVALRLAAGRNPWTGRSRCDGCDRLLGWNETVPLASFTLARGRCIACGHGIDKFHLYGEGFGITIALSAWTLAPGQTGILLALLGLVLLGQSLIDIKTYRLPDLGNLIVAGLCAILAWRGHTLVEGAIAAAVSGVVLLILKWGLEKAAGRTMLGLGDVKLVVALALALGHWTAAVVAVASLLALLALRARLGHGDGRLAFGPALAMPAFAWLLLSAHMPGLFS